jgi:LacI family transcriptional regulator
MKPNKPSVTLRDISAKSGVSITTASRILNHRETGIPIREETRQRVQLIAAQLGYKPNLLARGLRGSRSSLLGVIARDISDPFHIQILRGINDAANRRAYRVFLGHVNYSPDAAMVYGSMFEQSHADGIILIGDIKGDEAALQVLAGQHQFVAGVTDRIARRFFPGVYGDSREGTLLALEHLWALGHRRIVCISDLSIHDERLRVDVYREFMQTHGAHDDARVYVTTQEPQPSFHLGVELFARWDTEGATAIYAASDTIAIGIMQAAHQRGIQIPEQLSIVGYDNIDFCEFTVPPLTTISQDGMRMGEIGANLLMDMIEHGRARDEVDDVVLRPTLIVRQSTAPPLN